MRLLALCFLFLLSCQQKKLTIDRTINFQDRGLDEFDSQYFSEAFDKLKLKRPRLTKNGNQLYRLTVIPSLHELSYSIAIMKSDSSDSIDFRVLDESNGLLTINKKQINDTDSLEFYLNRSMVWELQDSLNMCNGSDGTYYIYESYDFQKNNIVFRWSPQLCKVQYVNEFLELIDYQKSLVKSIPSSSIVELW